MFKMIKKDEVSLSIFVGIFIPICFLFFYWLFKPTESLFEVLPILIEVTVMFVIVLMVSIVLTYFLISRAVLPSETNMVVRLLMILVIFAILSALFITFYPKVHEK